MAYGTAHSYRAGDERDVGTGRATGGVVGIYFAFGLGLGLLALLAAYAAGGVTTQDVGIAETTGGFTAVGLAAFPVLAAPIIAALAGTWAGVATRSGGSGALAGAIGSLLGTIVLFVVVGAGVAIGAAAGGVTTPDTTVNLSNNLVERLQFIASVAGIAYLIGNIVIATVAGALIGSIMPRVGFVPRATPEEYGEPGDRRSVPRV